MNLQAKTILVEGGVSLKKAGISRSKRMLDITVAVMALLLLSPVFLVIAISVSLSSSGPVLFKQKRSGLYGAPFEIYKFRSMKVHDENGVVTQAKKNDERVTTVGRFIRRTSLDELPQFINVLKGEMSLVGPRPHALSHDKYYGERIESYNCRFFVKPGITGWAQINGSRGETETLKKMEDRIGL
ncbi:sugar transferase, partial [Alcanivorax sp. HI0033]